MLKKNKSVVKCIQLDWERNLLVITFGDMRNLIVSLDDAQMKSAENQLASWFG